MNTDKPNSQTEAGTGKIPLKRLVIQDFITELHKAAKCVFIAADEDIAHDLSEKLDKSARLLEAMTGNIATNLFNSGYESGHHDTVESCFTPVFSQDMDTYQQDVVEELLDDLLNDVAV